tara:strand:- start:54 stop:368 length:315 start_codon:yes stop_codon:yes gene_type:complete
LNQTGDYENVIEATGDEPSPDKLLIILQALEEAFSHLGVGQLSELAVAKLERYSNAELAERFGCSERTIKRRLHLIREKYQQELFENDEHAPKEANNRGSGTDR